MGNLKVFNFFFGFFFYCWMPSGKDLSIEIRAIIHHNVLLGRDVDFIHHTIFQGDHSKISLEYLTKICRMFRDGSVATVNQYLQELENLQEQAGRAC